MSPRRKASDVRRLGGLKNILKAFIDALILVT